jgi:hypothetical protein
MGNYSFKNTVLPEPVNGVVDGHNFTQSVPNTSIYDGYTGLTFLNCNLTNCEVPVGSVVIGSKYPRLVSYCSHNNPKLVIHGLPECAVECEHLIITDSVTIDSVVVDTNYTYEDKAVI